MHIHTNEIHSMLNFDFIFLHIQLYISVDNLILGLFFFNNRVFHKLITEKKIFFELEMKKI